MFLKNSTSEIRLWSLFEKWSQVWFSKILAPPSVHEVCREMELVRVFKILARRPFMRSVRETVRPGNGARSGF